MQPHHRKQCGQGAAARGGRGGHAAVQGAGAQHRSHSRRRPAQRARHAADAVHWRAAPPAPAQVPECVSAPLVVWCGVVWPGLWVGCPRLTGVICLAGAALFRSALCQVLGSRLRSAVH